MNGCKAGVPTASPEVSGAIESELRRFCSQADGWEIAVHMLAQAGDPATAYTLARHDWYRLRRALEVLLVRHEYRHIYLPTYLLLEKSQSPPLSFHQLNQTKPPLILLTNYADTPPLP